MALSGGSRQLQLLGDKLQPEPFLMTKKWFLLCFTWFFGCFAASICFA